MTEQMRIVLRTVRAKRDKSLPDDELAVWARIADQYSVEQVQEACDQILSRETRGKVEPGDLARELGWRPAVSFKRESLRWWHRSGEHGGPWAEAKKKNLLWVAAQMTLDARSNPHDFHRDKREAFLALCDRRGIAPCFVYDAADAAERGPEALDAYIRELFGLSRQGALL